jgi:DNA-binding MarR family transcriptional regulator
MSTGKSGRKSKGTLRTSDAKFDTHALPMISFIYNRIIAGAAGSLRERLGLSVTEAKVAFHVGASNSMTAVELVKILGLDKAVISRATNRLIELGIVQSERDPKNASRNILTMTDSGRPYCDAVSQFTFAREEHLLSVLDAPEQEALLEALRKILAQVEPTNKLVRSGHFWE